MPDTPRTLSARAGLQVVLGISLLGVAALTLTPEGTGWTWGAPSTELRWYATGLASSATLLQLVGNLTLLVPPAALAVLVWPSLGRPARLVAAALTGGAAIEALQWALPLGRVVSPVDALLNAAGAITAGLLVSSLFSSARGLARA
jgi:VanZ like family